MASRRQNQNTDKADKAAANQLVIKSLLKLPANKFCADCKTNKLPRWASWNLGIFICIRCSGIHRGMGTHISRVKSVDLDSWTDEQLASMVKWGNSRANKYWEANLAPGHVPSEAKIENFIRTKYESKRWVMDGGMPDPSTLDDSGDEVPLNVVKQQLENRTVSSPPTRAASAPPKKVEASLFDDDDTGPTVAAIAAPRNQVSSKADAAPPKTSKPADSLLGFDDFFGPPQQATPRPESANSNPVGGAKSNRPDLKTSILSLYASAPKQQPARPQHQSSPSFGNSSSFGQLSYGNTSPPPPAQSSAFSDFNDAFSGLNFSSQPQPQASQPPKQTNAFANLTSPMMTRSPPVAPKVTPASSGGFFGAPVQKKPAAFSSNQPTPASSGLNDLFSMSSPSAPQPAANTSPKPFASSGFAFENAWSTPSAAAPVSTQTNVWGASNNSIASNAFAGLGTSSVGNKNNDDDFGAFAGGSTSSGKLEDDIFANVWK